MVTQSLSKQAGPGGGTGNNGQGGIGLNLLYIEGVVAPHRTMLLSYVRVGVFDAHLVLPTDRELWPLVSCQVIPGNGGWHY
jgi:hypothetical protein